MNDTNADSDLVNDFHRIEFHPVSGKRLLIRQDNPHPVRKFVPHASLEQRAETAAANPAFGFGYGMFEQDKLKKLPRLTDKQHVRLVHSIGPKK